MSDSRTTELLREFAENAIYCNQFGSLYADEGRIAEYAERIEQAIAATLGQGTCERVFIEDWLWECSACKSRWKTGHLFNYCPTCGRKVVEQ